MADVDIPHNAPHDGGGLPPPSSTAADNSSDPPAVASPDDNAAAAAAAEVAAMGPADVAAATDARNTRDPTADQAVMGAAEGGENFEIVDESGEQVKERFITFLRDFSEAVETNVEENSHEDDASAEQQHYFPYAEQASQLARQGHSTQDDDDEDEDDIASKSVFRSTMLVNFHHLFYFDIDLAEAVQNDYVRFEPFLQQATKDFVQELHPNMDDSNKLYFVAMLNLPQILPVRSLLMDRVGRLAAVTGTITRTSEVRPELLVASFRCNKCGLVASGIRQQFHYTRPTLCRNPRCGNASPNEFTLEQSTSQFCDWQKLRVQENSDEIPPGSMPRSMDVVCRNEMVERAKAGDKCVFVGSLVVIPDGSALSRAGDAPRRVSGLADQGGAGGVSGLKALGVRELTYKTCFVASSIVDANHGQLFSNKRQSIFALFGNSASSNKEDLSAHQVAMEFTEEERQEIRDMKASPHLYQKMAQSIAPTTFGHAEVKRGLLLMLLGGVHKTTPEGMRLRGDVNVCIVGDPSTAKSRFLKFIHAFLPGRAVYTSGKASSAAGLTAAVQRDQDTGEHCIEAGALMLADNGICCIDEFDKMDPTDQVAIHEAMEQQTISITKAGIQATLNARASILAAANPIYGRYDRTKTLKSNVALSAPILSRFDLFFVVLDECNETADHGVATHILNVHRCVEQAVTPPFSMDQMRRYIRFARTLHPKLTDESQKVLVDCYRRLRQGDTLGRSRTAYRITVRQLESMIRLSEALARLHCDDEIQPAYVREAFRLLKKSIIHVETEDVTFENEDEDEDDDGGLGGDIDMEDVNEGDGGGENKQAEEEEEPSQEEPTQITIMHGSLHPGEYGAETQQEETQFETQETLQQGETPSGDAAAPKKKRKKKKKSKKKKTQISFEQFEAISNAIATYLRSLEQDDDDDADDDDDKKKKKYLTWSEVVNWYLEQIEEQIGDSMEELERMKKLTNLVIRRLIDVDHILIRIGDAPTTKEAEQQTLIAVHPNYVVS